MNFGFPHFMALLPVISLTVASVVVMLCTAFFRRHGLIAALTLLGLGITLACLHQQSGIAAIEVTPLMQFDRLSVFFSAWILVAAMVVTLLSWHYFRTREGLSEELYVLLLTATLGAVVMVSSIHFASFFLGLEILSVSLFALVAYPVTSLTRKDRSAASPIEAGIKYLILAGIASAMLAMGMAFLYAATGELSFSGIQTMLQTDAVHESRNLYAMGGIVMILAGVAFKLALVPFHMWTPDVYHGAPAPVTAFLATVSKFAMLVLILRAFLFARGDHPEAVIAVVTGVAAVSMLVGNLLALQQNNVKRMLAYSSISHSGYVLVAFLAGMVASTANAIKAEGIEVEAIAFYIVSYLLTSLTAFGVVSVLSSGRERVSYSRESGGNVDAETRDTDGLQDYESLFWKRPVMASVFAIALLSSAGIPLTIGFMGKFYIFAAGVTSALWWLLLVLIASSGIGLFYYLRLVLVMFRLPEGGHDGHGEEVMAPAQTTAAALVREIPVGARWLMVLLGGVILWLGVYPGPLMAEIRDILVAMRVAG
ncbi:NADH dehydrogenase I, chain N [gamma proteobacterium HdN1]|nr:NADH dehydrogenase I, chain N [gamma proteobacterium HdN1]